MVRKVRLAEVDEALVEELTDDLMDDYGLMERITIFFGSFQYEGT